jgi:hypothetical protein
MTSASGFRRESTTAPTADMRIRPFSHLLDHSLQVVLAGDENRDWSKIVHVL